MKRWIKWTAGSALLLGVIVVATAASGLYLAEQKRNRYIDIKPRPVAYTTDAQTIERGRYLYASRGCTDCHGAQGTGTSTDVPVPPRRNAPAPFLQPPVWSGRCQ